MNKLRTLKVNEITTLVPKLNRMFSEPKSVK